MKAMTDAKATAQTALGWRHMGDQLSLRWGVVDEGVPPASRCAAATSCCRTGTARSSAAASSWLELAHVRREDGTTGLTGPVEQPAAFRGHRDEDGAGVARVVDAVDETLRLEAPHLPGHRRLRAAVERREVADPGRAALVDEGEEAHLRVGQVQAGLLGRVPVEPGDGREQVRPEGVRGGGAPVGEVAHGI